MRLLPVIAAAAVALLVAAPLIGPRLISEERLTREVNRLANTLGGAGLRVRGATDFALLPRPRLVLTDLSVPAGAGRGYSFSAERLELALAPLALLSGKIELSEARLIGPELVVERGRLVPHGLGLTPGAGAVLAESIAVEGGVYARASQGSQVRWSGLAGTLSPTRLGGTEVSLSGRLEGATLAVDGTLGTAGEGGRRSANLHFSLSGAGGLALARYSGAVLPDLGLSGRLEASAQSLAALRPLSELIPALRDAPDTAEWAVEAEVERTARSAQLRDLTLVLDDQPLRGRASFSAEEGASPRFDLSLSGSGIAVSPAAINALTEALRRGQAGVGGSVELSLGDADVAGLPLRRAEFSASLDAGRAVVERLRLALPGGGTLFAQAEGEAAALLALLGGDWPEGAGHALSGEVQAYTGDAAALVEALGTSSLVGPDAGWPGLLAGSNRLRVAGDFELDDRALRLNGVEARSGANALDLDATFARSTPPRLEVRVAAERLDVSGLDLQARLRAEGGWPRLPDAVAGTRVEADLSVERLRGRGWRARDLSALVSAEGGNVRVPSWKVADVAGIEAAGTASLERDPARLAVQGQATAASLPATMGRLGLAPPAGLALLGPVEALFEASSDDEGAALDARATAEGLRLDVRAEAGGFSPNFSQTPWTVGLEAEAAADSPEDGTNSPLRRVLASPLPGRLTGETSRISSKITNEPESALSATLSGNLGDVTLDGAYRLPHDEARPITIDVSAGPIDADLAALAYDAAAGPLRLPPRPLGAYLGNLPTSALRPALLAGRPWRLSLAATSPAGVEAMTSWERDEAGSRLEASGAPLAGGTLDAVARLTPRGDGVEAAGRFDLAGTDLIEALPLLGVDEPGVSGTASADLAFNAYGATPLALARNLSAEGLVELRDGSIDGVTLTEDGLTIAEGSALPFATIAGKVEAARGLAQSAPQPLRVDLPEGAAELSFELDLPAWILDAALVPKGGERFVRAIGPPRDPRLIQQPRQPEALMPLRSE